MTKEALKLALEALLDLQSLDSKDVWLDRWNEAITAIKEALAQPVQQMVSYDRFMGVEKELVDMTAEFMRVANKLAQPEERNFCSRCGKRTADLTSIHTCTPPQENT